MEYLSDYQGYGISAVWSRPLLVAYKTLLEISCHASFVMIVAILIVAEVVKIT